MKKYKVWDCKIVVPIDIELPDGFDAPPRTAAIKAVEEAGIEVLTCLSGWGGTLSDLEKDVVERDSDGHLRSGISHEAEPCESPKQS